MKKINYSNYHKPNDFMSFKEGENRIRILSSGIIGFQHVMKTATRFVNLGPCTETKDCEHCKKGNEAKMAWKWIVYDYSSGRVKILDAGPMIGNQICDIAVINGEPKDYDILVLREGQGLKTQYECEKAKDNQNIPVEEVENVEFMKHRLIVKYFEKKKWEK